MQSPEMFKVLSVNHPTLANVKGLVQGFLFLLLFAVPLRAGDGLLLYPGITGEQHRLIGSVLDCFYSLDWQGADNSVKKLQKLEKKHLLLPMSSLIQVAIRVWRVQNDEFGDIETKVRLLKEIKIFSNQGISSLRARACPDSERSTSLFIEGGIKGFTATLDMKSNPLAALRDGLRAVHLFDTAVALRPHLYDAYLGIGLFNCALAKSPALVKSAVDILQGTRIDVDSGLAFLRVSAGKALYTKYAAQLYLTRFLSPYLGDQSREKQGLFRTLQRTFPANPLFVFLELDERLCFFPDSFFNDATYQWIHHKMQGFHCLSYSALRYEKLVKWQYSLGGDNEPNDDKPDSISSNRDFSFYPLFLQAVSRKHSLSRTRSQTKQKSEDDANNVRKLEPVVTHILSSSDMNPIRKEFYLWHVRDALKM